MPNGEYMDRESIDRQTRHVSDVQRIESELEYASQEEADERVREAKIQAVERWESCNRAYKMLFEVLNMNSTQPLDLFDVKIDSKHYGNADFDAYIRVWKDRRDQTYRARPLVRTNGNIEDHDFPVTESFGDTYEYKFGTAYSHSAKIKMLDNIGGGIKLERKDGYLVDGISRYETAVLLAAIEGMILPSLRVAEDTLLILWDSVQQEELNPVHAKSLAAYFNRYDLKT